MEAEGISALWNDELALQLEVCSRNSSSCTYFLLRGYLQLISKTLVVSALIGLAWEFIITIQNEYHYIWRYLYANSKFLQCY